MFIRSTDQRYKNKLCIVKIKEYLKQLQVLEVEEYLLTSASYKYKLCLFLYNILYNICLGLPHLVLPLHKPNKAF